MKFSPQPQTTLLIRKAELTDASEIARLSAELGYPAEPETIRDRIEKTANRPDYLLIVCENVSGNGSLSGWLQAHTSDVIESGFRVEIVGLVVARDARRKGFGRQLVARAEQWAADSGARTINVRSNVLREEAHLFYPSLGYELKKTQAAYRKVVQAK